MAERLNDVPKAKPTDKESGLSPQSKDHSSVYYTLKETLKNCISFILALLSLTLHTEMGTYY